MWQTSQPITTASYTAYGYKQRQALIWPVRSGTLPANPGQPDPGASPNPSPIRLTAGELAYLRSKAGRRPLGAWCRDQLLGEHAEKQAELQQPGLDERQYAALLAALGHSRLSSNLNQLAKHANMGTLDVSQDTERQLQDAYAAILAMRDALLTALQVKLR